MIASEENARLETYVGNLLVWGSRVAQPDNKMVLKANSLLTLKTNLSMNVCYHLLLERRTTTKDESMIP